MNDLPFRVYAVKTKQNSLTPNPSPVREGNLGTITKVKKKMGMKRTVLTMLAFFLILMGASAQGKTETIQVSASGTKSKGTVKLEGSDYALFMMDSVTLDSVYRYWNNFVTENPKDENAWHKLCDAAEQKVSNAYWRGTRDWNVARQLRKELNVMPRMQQAIPGTYTYYYSVYVSSETRAKEYADSAIAVLNNNVPADDFDRLAIYVRGKNDTLQLTEVLTHYYESGQYPASALQYHYNELQGMEKGGVYLGNTQDDVIGKLIVQLVLGVHKDKILLSQAAVKEPVRRMFERIDIPFSDEIFSQFESQPSDERLLAIMRYIFEHSKRPVYLSARGLGRMFRNGIPDDLKACLYNEGLTMRYSAKPYNNLEVKRRNVEQRYLMDNLIMQFQPDEKSMVSPFARNTRMLTLDYLVLLHDLLPYYKKHNAEQFARLNRIFSGIMRKLSSWSITVPNSDKYYTINYSKDGAPHYEFVEKVSYKIDPNVDDATNKKRFEEHEKKKENRRVLIIGDPIEE